MANKKMALGKGLSALLSNAQTGSDEMNNSAPLALQAPNSGSVAMISVTEIVANPFQPRTEFEEDALQELAESIKNVGIIQPVTVRKTAEGYQLISGERRFRASQLAGLTEIPAYIRTADDQGMLEMALLENIQREDLNAIEVALSYQRLMEECNLTQEELSQRVAKKRSTITNYLRLLRLPASIQHGIKADLISMGHARALVSIDNTKLQESIYNKVLLEEWSVRKVEDYVRSLNEEKPKKEKETPLSENKLKSFKLMGDKLSTILKHPIEIQQGKNGNGKILISFESEEDLEKIIEFFDR